MEQPNMSVLRQRLAEIQKGLEVDRRKTKENVPMSGLAGALSEVFAVMDELAAAIEQLQRRSDSQG